LSEVEIRIEGAAKLANGSIRLLKQSLTMCEVKKRIVMAHRKILMIIAHEGFQHVEYGIPKKTFEQAGFTVITASNKPGTATAKDRSTTKVDVTIDQAIAGDYAAIVLVGGPGALDNLDNETTYQLVREGYDLGKLIAAICVSPRILAHASLLSEVAATGWDGDNQLADVYNEYGVTYVQAPVVSDQNIVTATDPSASQEFADTIVRNLKGK
jgi:protease I